MRGLQEMPQRAAYSITELAALWGVGRDKIYKDIREGRLEAHKWGRRTVVTAEALRKFLSELPPLRLPPAA